METPVRSSPGFRDLEGEAMDRTTLLIVGLVGLGLAACAVAILALLGRHMPARRHAGPSTSGHTFQPAGYAPMKRLLADGDFAFLRAQPGFEPHIETRLRKERRSIYRLYLKRLENDSQTLHFELRDLILSAPEDQRALLAALARQNFRFQVGLLRVRLDLVLNWMRLTGAPRETSRLLESAARMGELLRSMSPPAALDSSA